MTVHVIWYFKWGFNWIAGPLGRWTSELLFSEFLCCINILKLERSQEFVLVEKNANASIEHSYTVSLFYYLVCLY